MSKHIQLFFLCFAVVMLPSTFAKADTIFVDTLDDSALSSLCKCTLLSPCCQLRNAITEASYGDTITFRQTLAGLTMTLISGELIIDKNLIIDGDLNNDQLPDITIDASNNSRVLRINNGLLVTLDGLIIRGGYLNTAGLGGGAGIRIGNGNITNIKNSNINSNESIAIGGGGIENGSGILFLNNCNLINNMARNGGAIDNVGTVNISNSTFELNESEAEGGVIYNHADSTITISESVFYHNDSKENWMRPSPFYSGGAITNYGELTITGSTLKNNYVRDQVGPGWPIGFGGGIFNAGRATIRKSTFYYNSAEKGGAIMNNNVLKLTNSTVSNNRAGDFGAGIFTSTSPSAPGSEETLEIRNCTFAHNQAGERGGGIYFSNATALNGEHISNTIITNSYNEDCYIVPGHGSLETNTNNLIEDGSCSPAFSGDPLLEELADNGGPTETHALLPDSPAIDAGSNAEVLPSVTTDQRGNGFPRIRNIRVDIGSFEYPNFIEVRKNTRFFVIPHSDGKAVIFGL
jgi:predicted outer membrane repeat protein